MEEIRAQCTNLNCFFHLTVCFMFSLVQPVISAPPIGNTTGFRDPTTAFRTPDGLFNILIGSGIHDVGGTALLYTSPDLTTWTYRNPLCFIAELPAQAPNRWECPDLFFFGDVAVLKFSLEAE